MGKVSASLETSHYRGVVKKTVTVTSNDPETASVVLALQADVVTAVEVTPSDTPVIRMGVGEPKPAEITVAALDGRRFAVLAVQADPMLGVTVRPAPGARVKTPRRRGPQAVASGTNRYLVTITPRADLPVGQASAKLTLTTDLPKGTTVPIRAVIFVTGAVRVVPSRLTVRPAPTPPVLHVRISKVEGDALEIRGVESDDVAFSATLGTIAEGREYDVTVRYTGPPGRGAVDSRIVVKTNDPKQGSIVIPVTGRL